MYCICEHATGYLMT